MSKRNKFDYSSISRTPVEEKVEEVAAEVTAEPEEETVVQAEESNVEEVKEEQPAKIEVPAEDYGVKQGVVKATNLNIRASANKESGITTIVDEHSVLEIFGEEGDFYKVKTSHGIDGYAMKAFVEVK